MRVLVWKNPFTVYNEGGYQVAQSLMAIGTGSWFGMGLFQGAADQIPVAESDFIFSAIAEEMGLIFALGLILVCVSVYMMFLNIAMQLRDSFYKLVALGLGTCYIFQIFLIDRRCDKVHSVYRSDTSAGKLRWNLRPQYDHYVCDHSGTVYFKRRRGRRH